MLISRKNVSTTLVFPYYLMILYNWCTLLCVVVEGVWINLQIFGKKTPQVHLIIIREWPKNNPLSILRNLDVFPGAFSLYSTPLTIRHKRLTSGLVVAPPVFICYLLLALNIWKTRLLITWSIASPVSVNKINTIDIPELWPRFPHVIQTLNAASVTIFS